MAFAVSSLDFSNAGEVLREGLDAIARKETVCDLGGLNHVDSASIAVMLSWKRAALENRLSIEFKNAPESLVRLASVYGVADLLSLS